MFYAESAKCIADPSVSTYNTEIQNVLFSNANSMYHKRTLNFLSALSALSRSCACTGRHPRTRTFPF